jgi:hypothetical protein
MSFFSSLYRNGLWVSPPFFALAVLLLALFISSAARVVRQAHIVSVPLQARHDVEFAEAGRVVLCSEGPRITRRFAGLGYGLAEPDGAAVKGRRVWFRAITAGFSKARMMLMTFDIPRPGRYVLRVRGLETDWRPDGRYAIAFMRPHLARSVACVLGIVLGAGLLVGSIVLFFLRFASKGPGAA